MSSVLLHYNELPVLCCLVTDPEADADAAPAPKQDDAAYDIITEEEVNGIYDSDSLSRTTAGSQEGEGEAHTSADQ